VRFLGNASSGRQGAALAATAAARGARVTLVAAHTEVPDPAGATVVRVSTAAQLREAVLAAAADADAVVMAAAVADFRPAAPAATKIKKDAGTGAPTVELVRNPDVLADLVAARRDGAVPPRAVLVGFAAETGDAGGSVLEHGRAKLARKGADLIVLNDVSDPSIGFESAENAVTLVAAADEIEVPKAGKDAVAEAILDRVERLRAPAQTAK
jgi:phosphopantothenoylcysteine decarboxylase/phosphopantothenate--cysteine ligase